MRSRSRRDRVPTALRLGGGAAIHQRRVDRRPVRIHSGCGSTDPHGPGRVETSNPSKSRYAPSSDRRVRWRPRTGSENEIGIGVDLQGWTGWHDVRDRGRGGVFDVQRDCDATTRLEQAATRREVAGGGRRIGMGRPGRPHVHAGSPAVGRLRIYRSAAGNAVPGGGTQGRALACVIRRSTGRGNCGPHPEEQSYHQARAKCARNKRITTLGHLSPSFVVPRSPNATRRPAMIPGLH